jgi:hypothetical protein
LTPSENEASRRNLDRRVRTVSSKFVRTLFELCSNFSSKKVRTFVRRTSNFFESCEKEKRFGIYSIFAKFSNFSKKNELSRRSQLAAPWRVCMMLVFASPRDFRSQPLPRPIFFSSDVSRLFQSSAKFGRKVTHLTKNFRLIFRPIFGWNGPQTF